MKNVNDFDYKIGIIGVGYVGHPLALEISKKRIVYAYDINKHYILKLIKENKSKNIIYTSFSKDLNNCDALIVCVPTPVKEDKTPDLSCIYNACEIIGNNIKKDTLIIFESSYAPKTTMNVCAPLIEKISGMKCGRDFYIGYSPERINPSDDIHTLNTITKVISAQNDIVLNQVEKIYNLIDGIKLYKAPSIEVAEFSKILENTQRDVNIALMNEMVKLCKLSKLPFNEILKAARTKWNFYDATPGLVGGHCISVDPYFLLQYSKEVKYNLKFVEHARRINESMSDYIVSSLIEMIKQNFSDISKVKVGIYGFTYKANTNDIRNTKVMDIYNKLSFNNINCKISDYYLLNNDKIKFTNYKKFYDLDVLIIAVSHEKYCDFTIKEIMSNFNTSKNKKIVMDLNSIYVKYNWPSNYIYWNL